MSCNGVEIDFEDFPCYLKATNNSKRTSLKEKPGKGCLFLQCYKGYLHEQLSKVYLYRNSVL